jgi:hypothetical protein
MKISAKYRRNGLPIHPLPFQPSCRFQVADDKGAKDQFSKMQLLVVIVGGSSPFGLAP